MDGSEPAVKRPKHGAYPIWICDGCGFGIGENNWRTHRRECLKQTECKTCGGTFPCRWKPCPGREGWRLHMSDEVPGLAPRARLLKRLGIQAVRLPNHTWKARGPHHARDEWEYAKTWPLVYAKVMARRW